MELTMLTIQSYQPLKYRQNFKCRPSANNVKELSQSSQRLLYDAAKLAKSESADTASRAMRSRRFADGSFLELKNGADNAITLKYLRMNQKPNEVAIKPNGEIEYKNKLSTDLNSLIERYIPDIIEREQFKYMI